MADGNYSLAFTEYNRHAERNALAQFSLGLIEQNGWGRSPDAIRACMWFSRAARSGIPAAKQFFGTCLSQGIGNPVDGPAAIQWYKAAADQGLASAACDAGKLLIAGKVVPQDVAQGLALCTGAAQAESTPAMMSLAAMYSEGGIVAQDLTLARFWYTEAAERRVLEAQFRLGLMLSEGLGGDADLAKARFWLEHAAAEGYAPAYLPTAILYANAPLDPSTGALSPADLAKIYMWNSAAKAITQDPSQLAEISRIEALTLKVMPPQWKLDLDQRVAAHLKKFNETQDAPL
ncbi:hypothetical protein CE139_13550 [Pseudomonas oryzihabitans]|uniref:Sel1 repeat family protein n=2 Tax=Pseudomonas oryzihabitans TaxID=47885 RepID=A0A2Z5ABR0_9PSED|nr:hypothetical protein CE139_13550 [Pseudomonas oryzihabitans]